MGEIEDKVKGKFHEIKGRATGDRTEQVQGKAEQARGALKGKINEVKDNLAADDENRAPEPYTTGPSGDAV